MGKHQGLSTSKGIRGTRIALVTVAALLLSIYPVPSQAQTIDCTPDPMWTMSDQLAASEFLVAMNGYRASLGLDALELSPALVAAAEWKAAHMAATGLFSHDDPQRSWTQRITDCGYAHVATENIGWGYLTPADALAGWLGSDGHRRHIEDANAVVTGIAMVRSGGGVTYWVQVFGMFDESAGVPTEAVGASAPGDVAEPIDVPETTSPPPAAPQDSAPVPSPSVAPTVPREEPYRSWLRRGRRSLRNAAVRIDPRH